MYSLSKYQWPFFFLTKMEQIILKFVWKQKRPRIAKSILRMKNKAGGITCPDWKLYFKATVIETVWYWHKTRHIGQWNRIKEPRNEPTLIWSINLWQRMQEYTTEEKNCLFSKWFWENWTATCRRLKLDYFLITYTKVNSKWIKDIDIRPETVKLLEENIGIMLFDIGLSNFFQTSLLKQGKQKQKSTNGTASN